MENVGSGQMVITVVGFLMFVFVANSEPQRNKATCLLLERLVLKYTVRKIWLPSQLCNGSGGGPVGGSYGSAPTSVPTGNSCCIPTLKSLH